MKYVLITGATINTGVAIVEKFASEGKNIVFTGRNAEKVAEAEKSYRAKFPKVDIIGCAIDSLIDERTVDEDGVDKLFAFLDEKGIFVETLVLNAADQGLGQKIFENPLTDLMKVINTMAPLVSLPRTISPPPGSLIISHWNMVLIISAKPRVAIAR